MSTTEESDNRQPQTPLHRSASQPKPKGILKNAPHPQGSQAHSLQWDEENLALTEIQKDSLMKITEPKTPYVRYNAETDEIEGEIPHLNLGGQLAESPPQSPSVSSTGADTSGPSSRRTSISSSGRPGSGRSGSASSSRSTSFSLPNDSRKEIRLGSREHGGEVEMEEMDPEAAAKHAEFLRARGRHYSGEAEAMKRAKEMLEKEEEDENKMGGDKEGDADADADGEDDVEWLADEVRERVNGI